MRICSVENCKRPVFAAGLCSTHYSRKRKTGTTDAGPKARLSLGERFWSKVDKRGPDECWEWQASGVSGYGTIGVGGRAGGKVLAHRLSWELHSGPIPDSEEHHGTVVLHTCDNRKCVNPAHLRLGTQSDNVRDMDAKGRRKNTPHHGEKHGNAKLTDEAVRFIRKSNLPQKKLAEMFGVSKYPIYRIKSGKGWTHVT